MGPKHIDHVNVSLHVDKSGSKKAGLFRRLKESGDAERKVSGFKLKFCAIGSDSYCPCSWLLRILHPMTCTLQSYQSLNCDGVTNYAGSSSRRHMLTARLDACAPVLRRWLCEPLNAVHAHHRGGK